MQSKPSYPLLFTAALTLLIGSTANAHFAWLITDDNQHAVMFFGEDLSDRQYHLPESLRRYPLVHVAPDATAKKLSMQPIETDDFIGLRSDKAVPRQGILYGSQAYGLFHGSKLVYSTQHLLDADPTKWSADTAVEMDLRANLATHEGGIRVTVRWKDNPRHDAEVKLYSDAGREKGSAKTDKQGQVTFSKQQIAAGLNALRIGFTDSKDRGKIDGEAYETSTNYLTVTFDGTAVTAPASAVKNQVSVRSSQMADLPLELTSFGGAVAKGTLFVYGGHTGTAHSYSTAEQSDELWSLDLQQPNQWKKLASGPRLQGLAMVPHAGKLIRIGGFTAMNAEGEEHDLRSQATVSRFDPAKNNWFALADLPEPRSSHGAAVLDDQVFVAGGWAMRKGSETQWHRTAWKMELNNQSAAWKAIAQPPFQRRAVSVAAHDGCIYVIGGMDHKGKPSTRTDIYDPKTDKWSRGPALIGKGMTGFGNAAHALAGSLYVSTINGSIQRLSRDRSQWEIVGRYDPGRFFHCMLPLSERSLLLVGGANMAIGKFLELDILEIE